MTTYTVKITDKAMGDIRDIYDYLTKLTQSSDIAMKQHNRFEEAIFSLEALPERCPLLHLQVERALGMRSLLVDNYSIIYVVGKSDVTVLRILYSSSDLATRLHES